tara:strand:- start:328 stop:816 length:489 start_codon:yes stop_codon:yes gene_type:complete
MAGKYAEVTASLAPRPTAGGAYQDDVEREKRAILDRTLSDSDLAKHLIAVREERDQAKLVLAEITVRLTGCEQLIADAFEASGITSMKLDTGDTVGTQIKPYARVADRGAFRAWCVEQGYEDALALPWQTTNQLVAERLLDGQPEPDGIDTYKQTTVTLRRG